MRLGPTSALDTGSNVREPALQALKGCVVKLWLKLTITIVPAAILAVFILSARQRHVQHELLLMHAMRGRAQVACAAIKSAFDEVNAGRNEMQRYAGQASSSVLAVLGEPLGPEPAAPDTTISRVKPARPKPTPMPPEQPGGASDEETPEGILTPEQLRQLHAGKSGKPTPGVEKAPRTQPETPEPDGTSESDATTGQQAAPSGEPRIKQLGCQVIAAAGALNVEAENVTETVARAEATRAKFLAARTSRDAAPLLNKLENLATAAATSRNLAKQALQLAKAAIAEILKTKVDMEADRKKREEREQQRQMEASRRTNIQREISKVKETGRVLRELALLYDFDKLFNTLRDQLGNIEAEQARTARKKLEDRYTRLRDLHAFLIERINSNPFRWGWGTANSACDITGADEKVIRITGGSAAWSDVTLRQMLRIINHYLSNRALSSRIRATHFLGAAILCHENGQMAHALAYARKATDLWPRLEEERRRLLPLNR